MPTDCPAKAFSDQSGSQHFFQPSRRFISPLKNQWRKKRHCLPRLRSGLWHKAQQRLRRPAALKPRFYESRRSGKGEGRFCVGTACAQSSIRALAIGRSPSGLVSRWSGCPISTRAWCPSATRACLHPCGPQFP